MSEQTIDTDAALPTLHVGSPGNMFRFNGIGTTLVGAHRSPELGEWYFKRFAFTVLFVPIHVGRYYLVRRAKRGRGWNVAGWLSHAEFRERYGSSAANWLTLRIMAIPLIVAAAFAVLMVRAYILDEADLKAKALKAAATPAPAASVAPDSGMATGTLTSVNPAKP